MNCQIIHILEFGDFILSFFLFFLFLFFALYSALLTRNHIPNSLYVFSDKMTLCPFHPNYIALCPPSQTN